MAVPDTDLPQLFQAADRASTRGQASYLRWTRVRLALVVAAAACGIGQWRVGTGQDDLLGLLGAVLFLSSAIVEGYLWNCRPERAWYDGRALAESVKTLAWKYAVGGDPLPMEMTERQASQAFTRLLEELRQPYKDLTLGPVVGETVTGWMQELRRADSKVRRSTYLKERLDDQQSWYSRNADANGRRASQWRGGLLISEVLGVVMGLIESLTDLNLRFTPVVAAAIGAFVGWVETKQYEQIARAYGTAVTDLADARTKLQAVPDEDDWAREMNDAEDAISREHTKWLASRSHI